MFTSLASRKLVGLEVLVGDAGKRHTAGIVEPVTLVAVEGDDSSSLYLVPRGVVFRVAVL